jgi:hypothetical protein
MGRGNDDAVGELLGLLNGYSYTGGNPVNRVDHNGMCWTNASASPDQQTQCFDAWKGYADVVTDTFTQNWPRDVQILMTQEAQYWSRLSYTEFVNQWNSSRPSSRSNPGQGLQQGAGFAVGAGVITGPTPDDILWAAGALCLYGAALVAQTGAVALPLRQAHYFSESQDQTEESDDAIPLPRYGDCTKEQHNKLQKNVNDLCKHPSTGVYDGWISCNPELPCSELKIRRRRAQKCAVARARINRRCFRGGDDTHIEQLEGVRNAFENCNKLFQNKC